MPHGEGAKPTKTDRVLAVLRGVNGGMVTEWLLSAAIWQDGQFHKATLNTYIFLLRQGGHQIVRHSAARGYQLIEAPQ